MATEEERVEEILRKHDIKMNIVGCGCCNSPEVVFMYKGEKILDAGNCIIRMIAEEGE